MVWNWKVMWKVINITILTEKKKTNQVFNQMSARDRVDVGVQIWDKIY